MDFVSPEHLFEELPLTKEEAGKPRMALQAYMPALQGAGHKASELQIQECGGILSVRLEEKKEESFKDKNA